MASVFNSFGSITISTYDISFGSADALMSPAELLSNPAVSSPIPASKAGIGSYEPESSPALSAGEDGYGVVKQDKLSGVFSADWPEEESLAFCKPVLTKYVIKTNEGKNLFQAGVSALVGKPKCGKSTFLYSMIADLTRGGGVFGCNEPGKVIFAEHEDPRGTILCKVLGSGGTLSRVGFFNPKIEANGKPNRTEVFLKQLEEKVAANSNCRLIVVDSLGKLAPKLGFTMSASDKIRSFVDGLQAIGEKYEVAILVVNHFTKGSASRSLDDLMAGSAQFFASIRALWVAGRHPKEQGLRCVSFHQGNISAPCAGIVFRQVEVSPEKVLDYAKENRMQAFTEENLPQNLHGIELVNETPVPPEELVKPANTGKGEIREEEADTGSDEADEATSSASYEMKKKSRNTKAKLHAKAFVKWLVKTLSQKGEMLANEVEAEATNRGLKPGTYRKARKMAEAQGVLTRSKKVNGVKASYLFMENRVVASPVAETGVESNPPSDCGFSETIDKSFVFSSMT